MPITPNAPDYVGQVRGVIGDLRDNFLKKEQLYLQEKDQQDRMELARAQLGLQQQNSNQAAQLAQQKLSADIESSNAQIANQRNSINAKAYEDQRQALRDNTKDTLDREKHNLELFKENKKLEQEQNERAQDVASGQLLSEGTVALNSDNPTLLIEWTNKLAGSILNQKQRNDTYQNALSLVDAKKRLEIDGNNIKTQPKALAIFDKLNFLNVQDYTPTQFAKKIDELSAEYIALNNTDPGLSSTFQKISEEVAKRKNDFMQKDYGQAYGSYLNNAVLGELDPASQKAWDSLQKEFPDESIRNTSKDYADKTKRLMFQYNKKQSVEQLMRMEQQNQLTVDNLTLQNAELAAVRVNPITKDKTRTFPYPTPNLSPIVSYDAAIDPNTGLLNKSIIEENKAWTAKTNSPSYLLGQVPFTRGLNVDQKTPQLLTPEQAREISALPFESTSPTKFSEVVPPGEARVPVTPAANAVPISPQTLSTIGALYKQNPEATYNGRPVREVIARLKAAGYSIPEAGQTP